MRETHDMLHIHPASPTERAAEVLAAAHDFALRSATTDQQRQLFATALRGLDTWAHNPSWTFCIHLPLLVYGAIRGDEQPAVPLAAAMTLLYLGMDILDDLADGDEREHWQGYRPAEINLAAVTFIAALPPLAILAIEAPPERLTALQRTIAQMGLCMSAGQHTDITQAGSQTLTSAEVAIAAAGKTGAQCALFARLGAQLAGASPALIDTYTEMGHAYGMARQLAEDCVNLFQGERSRDLASGIRTYPIAHHLEQLTVQKQHCFLDLLNQARTDLAAQEQVRRELIDAGILRSSAFTIEVHCQRAQRILAGASPLEPSGNGLREMVAENSWITRKGATR